MKLFRWFFYTIMGIALIAGMYTGLRVFYIVFFTQFLTVIAVLALSLWTAQTFKFNQELSKRSCVKGEEVALRLEISNEKPFPLSLIDVHVDVVSLRENVRLVFSLAPYSGRMFNIPVTTPYRGRYDIGMTKLKITDIFGLTSFPFDMRRLSYYRRRELIVLPKAQLPGTVSSDIEDTKFFGNAYLRQAEQGDSISGSRLYRDGDALKRVNWKKSAQQGKLYVKQYDYPEKERVIILIDTALYGLTGEDALIYADTVCECAASISVYNLASNRSVYVVNSAGFDAPAECSSLSSFNNIRQYLALLPFGNKTDLYGTLSKVSRIDKQAYALFVLTRVTDPSSMQSLERILEAYRSVTMVVVGGPKPSGRVHTLYVEPGCDAAESLHSLHW